MRYSSGYKPTLGQKTGCTSDLSWVELPVFRSVFGLCIILLCLGGCATPETSSNTPPSTSNSMAAGGIDSAAGAKIDINSSPIAELDKLELPGTKASLSERIQGGRPYKTLDDLVSKKVISEDEFKLIKGLITTGKVK